MWGDWGWDGGVFSIVLGAVSGSVGWISAQLNHLERFDISVQRGLNNSRLKNTNFSPSHEKISFICEMCCSQTSRQHWDCLKTKGLFYILLIFFFRCFILLMVVVFVNSPIHIPRVLKKNAVTGALLSWSFPGHLTLPPQYLRVIPISSIKT